jgi:hypothetical protein
MHGIARAAICAVAVAASAPAATADAQQTAPPQLAVDTRVPATPEQVLRLEARARELQVRRSGFAGAARLYARAARLRSELDPEAWRQLNLASRLYWYAGNSAAAAELAWESAGRAAATGHIFAAADGYLDVVIIEAERGRMVEARDALRRAELLMNSPHLDDAERQHLERRLGR